MKALSSVILLLATVGVSNASVLDFNSGVPAGLTLGGNMTWNATGGGHIYMEQFYDNDFVYFASPTTVTSFEMNSNPWDGYGFPTAGTGWLVDIAAFDVGSNLVWSATVDLTGYFAWNQWLTVNVNAANVSTLEFYSPYYTHGVGFWPSIDNMVTNTVPEPASLMLLCSGLGALGLAAWRKRK